MDYFRLGLESPAYKAVEAHGFQRMLQWLRRKHWVRSGEYLCAADERLWETISSARRSVRKCSFE